MALLQLKWSLLFSLGLICWTSIAESNTPLTDRIRHYEGLNYNTETIQTHHERLKRSDLNTLKSHEKKIYITFYALNRTFSLELWPSQDVFAPNAQFLVHTDEGIKPSQYDPASFYRGKLQGQLSSKIHGHIQNGVFDGDIFTEDGDDHYHIEYAHKFFNKQATPTNIHSVIYSHKDIIFNLPGQNATCALKKALLDKLQAIQATAKPVSRPRQPLSDEEYAHTLSEMFKQRNRRHLEKRADTVSGGRYCQIFVAVDHLFLSNIASNNEASAVTEVTSVFAIVQSIYQETDFNSDGTMDTITPQLVKTEVLNSNSYGGLFSSSSISVENFLDRWSQIDHTAYCLSLLLTYRDFSGGVLGLAWVAQPPGGSSGGICEGRVSLSVGQRSLNTAIVTYLNYGSRQPRGVVTITVAHEFGHNFGSSHDPEGNPTCSPGSSNGNYIMYPRATDGTQRNNDRFSPCSINSIYSVLTTKSSCFRSDGSFCGNQLREEGERCDCGSNDQTACDMVDRCCNATTCELISTARCSASDSCCENCQVRSAGHVCSPASECAAESRCLGNSSSCPTPFYKNISCMNGTRFCENGQCTGSVCKTQGWQECLCNSSTSELCHVCCALNGTCISTFTLSGDGRLPVPGQFRESGRSCNNFRGYCSDANPPECIGVDNEQTLNDLLDIFTLETLNSVIAWLKKNWWVPIVVIVVIIILIVLLHLTYRKRKPIKKAARRASGTVRRRSAQEGTDSANRNNQNRRQQQNRQEDRETLQRLKKFFPTCESETIIQVYRTSRTEQKTVKQLLTLGFPLKKLAMPRL